MPYPSLQKVIAKNNGFISPSQLARAAVLERQLATLQTHAGGYEYEPSLSARDAGEVAYLSAPSAATLKAWEDRCRQVSAAGKFKLQIAPRIFQRAAEIQKTECWNGGNPFGRK